mgnify:CR=1 FL=1
MDPREEDNLAKSGTALFGVPASGRELVASDHADLKDTNQRVPPQAIQHQLWHASSETTVDTYGHLYPETTVAVVQQMDGALFANVAKSSGK